MTEMNPLAEKQEAGAAPEAVLLQMAQSWGWHTPPPVFAIARMALTARHTKTGQFLIDLGVIDNELLRVAPALIKEGMRALDRVIEAANIGAMTVSAFLIVSPLAAYYNEVFSALRQAGH